MMNIPFVCPRWKKYASLIRMRFLGGLQYRAAALAGLATQFAWGFMELLLFSAFYRSDPAAFPMEFSQMSCYIWLQQALLGLFMMWAFDGDIFEMIVSGSVAYELCRPADLYAMWLCRGIAGRLARTALRCLPILAVAVLLPAPYRLTPPASLSAALLFPVSAALGVLVAAAAIMLVYISTFYTLSPMGVRVILISVSDLLTGGVLPIPLMPDGVRQAVELLPFACVQDTALRVYSGELAGKAAALRLALQLFWALALLACGRLWMARALRRVVAQGG